MSGFTGTGTLLRFALRRDRVVLPAWGLLFLAYTVGGTAAAVALYPDTASRLDAANAVNAMPALVAMYGRVWDPTSIGAVAMMKPIGFGGIFAALFAVLLVTRHTRTEEESGRLELIGAQPVGRYAPLGAALLLTTIVMTVFCLLDGVGVMAAGLPASGAWAFAVSVSLTGMCYAGVAAVAVQLTASARTANTIALLDLALAFVLRGTADIDVTSGNASWWTWLSPIGWQDQVKAFAGDHWLALIPFPVAIVTLMVLSFALAAQRDLGGGMLPEHVGKPNASASLASPFALVARLQRGLFIGVLASYLFLSLLLGTMLSDASRFFTGDAMRTLLTLMSGTDDPFIAFMEFEVAFTALITAMCGVLFARRIGSEEQAGRVEPVLATAVTPQRLLAAHIAFAVLATTALQLTMGLGSWFANGLQTGDYSDLGLSLAMPMLYLPAIWVILAITFAIFAWLPAYTSLGWVALGACLVIDEFGPMLHWPNILMDLSPFQHVPHIPGSAMAWPPVLLLVVVAGALLASAVARYRVRDLATP